MSILSFKICLPVSKSLMNSVSVLVLTFFVAVAPASFAADKSDKKTHSFVVQNQSAPVNINKASIKELTLLKGVGEKKAIAIVQWRTANGKFKTFDQLAKVKGIGKAIVEQNKGKMAL
ncbi:MAG: competence protein ComEA [Lentisphaeria bacterium]|jgi:competence protein ComEA